MYPYDTNQPGNQYPSHNQNFSQPGNQAPYQSYGGGGGMFPQNMPGQPAYPGQNQPMPGFGGGFAGPQQSYPGYPPQSYPNQPFPSQPGYPPQQPGYPPQQPGYPTQQPGYPPTLQAQPGFPNPILPSSTVTHSAYADQTPNPSSYPQTGYPAGPQPPAVYGSGYGQIPSVAYSGQPPISAGYGQQQTEGYGAQPPTGGYGSIAAINASSCYSERGNPEVRKERKGTPTVVPVPNFDALNDAKTLRKAMKGFGTDEDAIINVLCFRTNEQRQIIQREFKTCYGKDLIEDIKSEVSGNFENLLVSMLIPLVEFYVKELHNAMIGIGTDEDVLIEVFCSLSNYEINTIKHAYYTRYMIPLEKALISETSGNFKRLLVSLCAAGRDESGHVDPTSAQRDAQELLNAGQLRFGTDESTFNLILCKRNYQQLQLICEEYQKLSGHSLEKAIRREFSGDIMDGLLAIVACVTNKYDFFASRLHKSMSGLGTKDNQLMRLLITRCEIDLHDIKFAFERNYGKSLKNWIKSDASGHYKHCLLALCGENKS